MIKDQLVNASLYDTVHPLFKAAFAWISGNASPEIQDGRFELNGNKLVAITQHYSTHPFDSKKFETHQKYIDIQYMVSGSEKIYLGDPNGMTVAIPHNETKDIAFFEGRGHSVTLNAGDFLIIWPHEAHAPGSDPATSAVPVHKIVMKVAREVASCE